MTARTALRRERRLRRRTRNTILTVHIVSAVGLLGDSAGFLAVAVRGTTTGDPALEAASYELARMFSYVFGIPLSFIALGTGLVLAVGGPWGVLRSPWVTAKLVLLVSVVATGALAIDPALESLLDGRAGSEAALVAAAAWQVLALTVATTLSVFKPGGRGWARGRARDATTRGTGDTRVPPAPVG